MLAYVADIESKLKRIEEDPEGAGTLHLFNCIQGVSTLANRAFGPLFERQVGRIKILISSLIYYEVPISQFFIFLIEPMTF